MMNLKLSSRPSLRIEKYTEVLNWYKNPLNRDYSKTLELDVAGVPHVFAWVAFTGPFPNITGKVGLSMWMWLPITRL